MEKKNNRKNSRGTVTVFLTMVLVPCLIFSCAFGDVSRVQLSKAQAASAADLAMYSLMANYDEELKEWYGLVASCQTIDEFYDTTQKYFTGMMDANGVDGMASDLFIAYLDTLRTGGDFTDFLKVEFVDAAKVDSMGDEASMGKNPALIEDGIVEFMKYRGPVEIVANVVDRFKSLNILGDLKNSDKNKPIVDAKTDAAEKEGEVLSEALYTFIALTNYQQYFERHKDNLMLTNIVNNYPHDLSCIRDDFLPITDLITKYYVFEGISDMRGQFYTFAAPSMSGSGEDRTATGGGSSFGWFSIGATKEEDEDKYKISANALQSILSGYKSRIDAIKSNADAVAEACNGLHAPQMNEAGEVSAFQQDQKNPARYFAFVQNALVTSNRLANINSYGSSLMQDYARMKLASECDLPPVPAGETPWSTRLSNAIGEIEHARDYYLTFSNGTSPYEQRLEQYRALAFSNAYKSTFDDVNDYRYEFNCQLSGNRWAGASITVGQYIKMVREFFVPLMEDLNTELDYLDTIINGGTTTWNGKEYTAVSLDELKQAIIDYKSARENWGQKAETGAQDPDNGYAQKEYDEYQNAVPGQDDSKVAAQMMEVDPAMVDELKTRLTNVQTVLQDLKTAIESLTYGGKTIYNMEGRKAAKDAATSVVPTDPKQVDPYLKNNAEAAKGYYEQLISPKEGEVYTAPTPVSGRAGNDPDLGTERPELYEFLSKNINISDLDQITDKKDEFDGDETTYKDQAKKEADSAKGADKKFLLGIGTDPGSGHSSNTFGAASVLTGMVGVVETLLSGNFDEFRDQLYVCEYAMDMFSWSSYNNEGQHKLAEGRDQKKLTYKPNFVEISDGGYGYEGYYDDWTGKDGVYASGVPMLTKFDNRSLTNRPINKDNNKSNLAEIEYILYGKSTNEENLKTSYNNIFVIREALNLISGFANFYSVGQNLTANTINTIAVGLQAATCGIVPVPLTKVVIIGILSTLETSYDMQRLKAGVPVALYKTDDKSWRFKIPPVNEKGDPMPNGREKKSLKAAFEGLLDAAMADPYDDNGLYYSDYLFIFMAVAANDTNTYKGMLLRIGDLIEANMNAGKSAGKSAEGSSDGGGDSGGDGKGSSFDLDKAMVYFQITGKLRVKPLFMDWSVVNTMDNVDTDLIRENLDWCTYSVKFIRGYS